MRLLVIRTSAMGDVALTTPVLSEMRKQYPDVELVLLTGEVFKPFFASIPGLIFFFPDFKDRHKGIMGLIRLLLDVKKSGKFDLVVDLHDVLRTKLLRLFLRLSGVPVFIIDKGRSEKRSLINGKNKNRLKHSVERYSDVFALAGFPIRLSEGPWITPSAEAVIKAGTSNKTRSGLNIGVAPYAKHKLKVWPEENMLRLLNLISEKHKPKFWLFGGKEDQAKLDTFSKGIADSISLAGRLDLDEELALMSSLDLMIAMDSSNMHMAALAGIKVISIWGGTDPLSGFGAWRQPEEFSICIPLTELTCRPCTIFGKGECRRGDFACMNWLTPEMVFQKMDRLVLHDLSK